MPYILHEDEIECVKLLEEMAVRLNPVLEPRGFLYEFRKAGWGHRAPGLVASTCAAMRESHSHMITDVVGMALPTITNFRMSGRSPGITTATSIAMRITWNSSGIVMIAI